ncbi:hypothetical protein OROMI_031956 [Orobanche minor]
MGVISTILGIFGFGMGFSAGLVIGYFLFIYSQPNDVKNPEIRSLAEHTPESLQKLLPEIPLWIKNPDYDRLDWLNKFVEYMWPYLDKAICKMAKQIAEPIISEQIPKYKIDSVEFEALILGSLPPTFQEVFGDDIFGDLAVSCSSSVGLKHRHNLVRDTLFDICFRAGISSGKEVDFGVVDGLGRPLRPADILLYSWDRGRHTCVDITGSSPLTQTCLASFAPGRCVLEASRRKCAKYRDVCSTAGYGFLPFSFSSFGELDGDAVALLGRIRSFSLALDSSSRLAAHIFTRVCFSIAKGVGAQLVSRLSANFL